MTYTTPTGLMFAALALLTCLDHVSTNVFLKRGVREGNPFLSKVIALWGSTGLFVCKAASFAFVFGWHVYREPLPVWLLALACAAYAAAIAWNAYVMRKRGVL